jgi:hypothetical protein
MGNLDKIGMCSHCKRLCTPVELDEDKTEEVDFFGVDSLSEVDQYILEGGILCEKCYSKEGGIV